METKAKESYSTAHIVVLEGLEAVRRRPGMYVGNVNDGSALHQLLWEVVDNAIREHREGFGDRIRVVLHDNGTASVEDDGRGISVAMMPERGVSALEVVMTKLNAGGRFNQHTYVVSAGPHGVGISPVTALSSLVEVTVHRDGHRWQQRYSRGIPLGPLVHLGPLAPQERTGTRLTFLPDPDIFKNILCHNPEQVRRRLEELALLHPALTLELHHGGQSETFHAPEGLVSLVSSICQERPVQLPLVAFFSLNGETDDGAPMWAGVALQWLTQGAGERVGFANGHRLSGGSPFVGSSAGIVRGVQDAADRLGMRKRRQWRATSALLSERLVLAVQVHHPAPKFGSRTKEMMVNKDIGSLLRRGLAAKGRVLLEDHPEVLWRLMNPQSP